MKCHYSEFLCVRQGRRSKPQERSHDAFWPGAPPAIMQEWARSIAEPRRLCKEASGGIYPSSCSKSFNCTR